jgi:hypothetical protein
MKLGIVTDCRIYEMFYTVLCLLKALKYGIPLFEELI